MPSTVQLGSTGDDVKRVQRVLARLKVGSPVVDGVFSAQTDAAVRSFQQGEGIAVDGVVGPATWSRLPAYREASPALRLGAEGPAVALLQRVLANASTPYAGAVDGRFGQTTDAAVRAYQTDHGLPANGVVDDRTWLAPAGAAGATLESLSGIYTGI
jgi:peptidoglycan hydrolase-like protein with peptidoglycan-binding domain